MFTEVSKKITKQEIEEIQDKLNIIIPTKLVEHYLKYNGGIPQKQFLYSYISDIETSVHAFLPMKYKDEIGYTLEELYIAFTNRSVIPRNYFPFAIDAGNNLFCVDLNSNKIVIIWLDMGDVNEETIQVLTSNFDEFIASLEEEE